MAAISWKTGVSGNWSLATNWSSSTVPGGGDDVTIDAAGSYTVNVDGNDFAGTLLFDAPTARINISAGDRLTAVATLTGGSIDGPGTFRTDGVSQITPGASLTLGGGVLWFLDPGSTVNLSAAVNVGDASGPTASITND